MRAITRPGSPARSAATGRPSLSSWPGAEILDQRVALGSKAQHQLLRAGLLQVERDAALVAAVHAPPGGLALVAGAPLPHRVAGAWRLHLDDIGAKVAEQPRAEGRRDEVAKLQDAQARQGARARAGGGRSVIALSPSVGGDVADADHLGPFGQLALDPRAELGRGHRAHDGALLLGLGAELRRRGDGGDLGRQAFDQRRRGAGRGEDGEPGLGDEAGQPGLGSGRHLRQRRVALLRGEAPGRAAGRSG